MNTNTINLAVFVKRSDDGTVDMATTLSQFELYVKTWEENNRADLVETTKQVHAVFDKYPGARINTPALVSAVAANLGIDAIVNPEGFKMVADRVKDILHTDSAFEVGKGRAGGVCRVSDKPENKAETKAA